MTRIQSLIIVLAVFSIGIQAEARIRNRKVKDAPKVCGYMLEDKLLSRPDKTVFSTERYSLIIEDKVTLVKDKGEKTCEWSLDEWSISAPLKKFQFYIDEYKEILYPYAKKEDGQIFTMQVRLSDCRLSNKNNKDSFLKPSCEKPKKVSRKKKAKSAKKS